MTLIYTFRLLTYLLLVVRGVGQHGGHMEHDFVVFISGE